MRRSAKSDGSGYEFAMIILITPWSAASAPLDVISMVDLHFGFALVTPADGADIVPDWAISMAN